MILKKPKFSSKRRWAKCFPECLIIQSMQKDELFCLQNSVTNSEKPFIRAGGYFADWLMESGPGFLTSETTEDVTITTTLDQRIQRAAERALQKVFDEKVKDGSTAEAAVVVMSADGAVRAIIGGRDTRVNGVFNRATQAKRQTGSRFKPFVYAAALEAGYSPSDRIEDGPLTIRIPGGRNWSPIYLL